MLGGGVSIARHFVIATGSKPAVPPIPGLSDAGFETNVEAVNWETLPRSLAILGAGPIGVEFAQLMARFGVQVTLVEQADRILDREEPEASAVMQQALAREGVDIVTGALAARIRRDGVHRVLDIDHDGQLRAISAERLLIATGRVPVTESLGLDSVGIHIAEHGIVVDSHLRTSQPHIFAVGDVNGSPQLTHVAEDQGRTVAKSIIGAGRRFRGAAKWSSRVVPRVTFTDPEVASVGLTERQARRKHGKGVRVWDLPLSDNDRAITTGATDGFLKLVTAPGWQRRIPGLARRVGEEIVGACFVAPGAGDLLMPVVMAMRARLPVGLVAWNMQAYPTLALGVRQVAGLPFDDPR